jgi:phage terminase large subunit-like protein
VTVAIKRSEAFAALLALVALPPERRRVALAALPEAAVLAIAEEWWWRTHGGQLEPFTAQDGGPWRVWAIVAGRGFGKTRAGAEWVWARARGDSLAGCPPSDLRIALVAATLEEGRSVMVEGDSGLLACARIGEEPRWLRTRRTLVFPSGAEAYLYSAGRPDSLRGPQHHFAWCDELAKWSRGDAAWDNLMLGLRLGERPRTIVTTTPRPVPLMKRILGLAHTAATHGRTDENPHSAADFRTAMRELYGHTRLGRQELEGLLLEDLPGALWTRDILEKARDSHSVIARSRATRQSTADGEPLSGLLRYARNDGPGFVPAQSTTLRRVVIGVDPPASAHGDSCGIVVCGMGADDIAYVLADLTVEAERPEGWARRVAAAAEAWDAQKVVAEKNQGGDMVESVLRAAAFGLPVKLVTATKGKAARAEPIALHFEAGRARLAGHFPELEDQLCGLTYTSYEGPGNSPDRADAMVWAMTELFAKPKAEPRIRVL